jgi:hypothetical protein
MAIAKAQEAIYVEKQAQTERSIDYGWFPLVPIFLNVSRRCAIAQNSLK